MSMSYIHSVRKTRQTLQIAYEALSAAHDRAGDYSLSAHRSGPEEDAEFTDEAEFRLSDALDHLAQAIWSYDQLLNETFTELEKV